MSLHLDSRQRAMLKEMGVSLWWPGAMAQEPAATPSTHGTPPQPAPTVTTHAAPAPIKAPQPLRPVLPVQPATLHGQTLPARVLLPPRALFPGADPQHTPAALGAGWLIVADGLADADPLEGEAGRLLGNMLRALQLHRHPQVFLCALSAAHGPSTNSAPPRRSAGPRAGLRKALGAPPHGPCGGPRGIGPHRAPGPVARTGAPRGGPACRHHL